MLCAPHEAVLVGLKNTLLEIQASTAIELFPKSPLATQAATSNAASEACARRPLSGRTGATGDWFTAHDVAPRFSRWVSSRIETGFCLFSHYKPFV